MKWTSKDGRFTIDTDGALENMLIGLAASYIIPRLFASRIPPCMRHKGSDAHEAPSAPSVYGMPDGVLVSAGPLTEADLMAAIQSGQLPPGLMEAVTRAMQMGAEARQNMSQYAAPAPQAKPTDTLASTEAYSRAILKAHTTMTERIASAKGSENPEEAIQQAMKTAEATIAEINAAHPEAAAAASAVNK